MKFAVLQFFSWPERRVPLPVVYERALERIRIMDSSGYDAVWLAEHHFGTYSVCPSVHLMAMHVAGMTRTLRIGTAVSLAAFYHPLRYLLAAPLSHESFELLTDEVMPYVGDSRTSTKP